MLKFHCNGCGEHKEVTSVALPPDDLGNVPWVELACDCGHITATLSADEPGVYEFAPKVCFRCKERPVMVDYPGKETRGKEARICSACFVDGVAELLSEVSDLSDDTDTDLRAFGYDPDEVGRRIAGVVQRALDAQETPQ